MADGDPKALKSVKDFFRSLLEKLKTFDFQLKDEVNPALIYERTVQMIPVRNETINILIAVAEFGENLEFYKEIQSFFEKLIPYFSNRSEDDSRMVIASDHYKLFGYELFLYAAMRWSNKSGEKTLC